jgi:hypothetical protein
VNRVVPDDQLSQQGRAESQDFMEGVLSFMQKRPPVFTGE